MTTDTTDPSYWLNWRFALCAVWLLTSMVSASIVIWKYEGLDKSNSGRREHEKKRLGVVYQEEAWRTCLNVIHPAWLLGFRIFALIVLLALLVANVVIDGGGIFYFYTQWTFTLVTIYFGFGSAFSIYGCCQHRNKVNGDGLNDVSSDVERGTYMAPAFDGNADISNISKSSDASKTSHAPQSAGFWGYTFQIIFQMCAGAAMLTDCVFWLILVPFLTSDDFRLTFLIVCMHSVNAVFLLGDTMLNSLRFPFFRIVYFVLWTAVFVIFQWTIHACVSLWWPYPFLDLSSSFAPLWYFAVGVIHIPCYGIFSLIFRLKQFLLSKSFPESYQRI